MACWRMAFIICCGLYLAGLVQAAAIPGELGDRLETDRYDCSLELTPAKSLGSTAAVRVVLEATAANASISVVITKASIAIFDERGGARKSLVATVTDTGITPGAPYRLTIMRREGTLGLLRDNTLLYRGAVPRGPGDLAGVTMDRGWTQISPPSIQRLEPVHFEDDFMRADATQGLWIPQSGTWALQSAWDNIAIGNGDAAENAAIGYGQNPFALVGSANVGPAITTAGDPFWEDYTFSVAVQPGKDTGLGMLVNMTDAHNGLLVRWTSVIDHTNPGRLTLQRFVDGKATDLIADSPGGFMPRQWYKLTVISSLTGVQILVDGVARITQRNLTPWRGGIGLYAEEAAGVVFDDVKVFGRTFDADLLFEAQQTNLSKRFEIDQGGMATWANPNSAWLAAAGLPGHYWYGHDVFGEQQWLVLTVRPKAMPTGEIWMTLNGDGQHPTAGLRAVAQVTADPAKITYTLYQDEKVLASKTVAPVPTPDAEYAFRFRRAGTELWLEVDGDIVVKATGVPPVAGLRPAYRATGCFADAHDQVVLSYNLLDYSFSNAPTDWLFEGTWEPTNRWSCSPMWSFLGGWSRGDAVLWHKQRFTGDQSFEAFLGAKMEYPRQRDTYENHFHDFNLTICGDGRNPRSGYTGSYATAEKKIALYRNGVEVAGQLLPDDCIPCGEKNHHSWFDLTLRKHGNTVEFTAVFDWLPLKDADGKVTGLRTMTLSFSDTDPIVGGVPAIWTSNNGITVARTRIDFANPPMPQNQPQLALAPPWYPEWANVGEPLTLELSDIRTTTDQPIRLSVTPRGVPAADAEAVRIDGTRLTFTPRQAGRTWDDNHWYEIQASAGDLVSPSVHLDLHVFDPKSYRRDDSHALVLYRFDEGRGDVVRDQSGHAPGADLTIGATTPKGALSALWLPGQGLVMRTASRVSTEKPEGMDRVVQAVQQSHACTVEFWASFDTVFPPYRKGMGYAATLFSWDLPGTTGESRRNLTIMPIRMMMALYPRDVPVKYDARLFFACNLRPGLAHMVISWDGAKTTLYKNGEFCQEMTVPWNVEKMTPGSLLFLGNSADSTLPYFGTFYFLAFHDKAFTAEDAKRHYLAGPSGR